MKRLLIVIGLTAWALASVSCLAVGIYGGITQATTKSHVVAVPSNASLEVVPVVTENMTPVVVIEPAKVQEPVVTDNTPCGAGCVRASFTVVNP